MAQLTISLEEYDSLRRELEQSKVRTKELETTVSELKQSHKSELNERDKKYKDLENDKRIIIRTNYKTQSRYPNVDTETIDDIISHAAKLSWCASSSVVMEIGRTIVSKANALRKTLELDSLSKSILSMRDSLDSTTKTEYKNLDDIREEMFKEVEKEYKDKNSNLSDALDLKKTEISDLKREQKKEIEELKNKNKLEKEALALNIKDLKNEFDAYKENKTYEEDLELYKNKNRLVNEKLRLLAQYVNKPWYSKSTYYKTIEKQISKIDDQISDLTTAIYEDTDNTRHTRRIVLEKLRNAA